MFRFYKMFNDKIAAFSKILKKLLEFFLRNLDNYLEIVIVCIYRGSLGGDPDANDFIKFLDKNHWKSSVF